MRQHKTIIVIPCFNEAERLDVEKIVAFVRSPWTGKLLFVNDGSTDDTLSVLECLSSNSDQIDYLELRQNVGKAEAVRRGLEFSLDSKPDFVGYWDADLATPLEEIARFEQCLLDRKDLQMALGCRIDLQGCQIQRRLYRRVIGRCFSFAASQVLGMRIFDTQCGAKLFRATRGLKQVFEQPFLSKWIFDVEIVLRLQAGGASQWQGRFLEVPVFHWKDVDGSKLRLRDGWAAIRDLFQIGLRRSEFRSMVSASSLTPGPSVLPLPVDGRGNKEAA